MQTSPGVASLEVRHLTKRFGMTQALDRVSLTVTPGEIHALVGQNGSGKSTLIKILSGYHGPDDGEVRVRGSAVHLPIPPGESVRRGLCFLHQDLGLAGGMTVLENVGIGGWLTTGYGRLRWKAQREQVRAALAEVGFTGDLDVPVARLPPAERALVAFGRALRDLGPRGGVLILDEPTAYLPLPAVERMFQAMRAVAARGSAVLFVSHRLAEVLGVSDRISVLRNGRLVGTVATRETTREQVVEMILGRQLGTVYPEAEAEAATDHARVRVEGLSGATVRDVSFAMRPGEIVGITGLVGMGHDDVPYLLFGAQPARAGQVHVGERGFAAADLTPARMRAEGMALLPADRRRMGGVLAATVLENVTLPRLADYYLGGRLRHGRERAEVQSLLERFAVVPPDPGLPLAALSGGNQQKALLAKWLGTEPRVLLLHEPTQGVDVGSRKEIFRFIRAVAGAGVAMLIASAEYEDLAHMCDKVLVMRHGTIVRTLAGDELSEDRIVEHCYLAS